MKIETTFSDPKVRVSYQELEAIKGAVIQVSFRSGGRYDHGAARGGSWSDSNGDSGTIIDVYKIDNDGIDDAPVGEIRITNPIDFPGTWRTVLSSRSKESVYFFILPTASIYEGKDESYVEHKNYEDKPHDD